MKNLSNGFYVLGFMKYLASIKEELKKKTRYSTYFIVSIWKMVFFLACTVFIFFIQGGTAANFFSLMPKAFQPHKIIVSEVISFPALDSDIYLQYLLQFINE